MYNVHTCMVMIRSINEMFFFLLFEFLGIPYQINEVVVVLFRLAIQICVAVNKERIVYETNFFVLFILIILIA